METKKTVKADLEKKSPLFFSIGLVVTMSMVVYAFELKQHGNDNGISYRKVDLTVENFDIPSTDHAPVLPPAVKLPQIILVPDDKKLEDQMKNIIDINSSTDQEISPIPIDPAEEVKEEPEVIVDFAEEPAAPINGTAAFYKYVGEKIKYPMQAQRMGIEGRVFVSFVIGKDGSISDVKAIKGIGAGCDEEAVRIIQNAPVWKPGRQGGRTVKQRMVIPIIFKIN